MKRQRRTDILQLKLMPLDLAVTEVPADTQIELAQALAELLLNAVSNGVIAVPQPRGGGDHESEVNL